MMVTKPDTSNGAIPRPAWGEFTGFTVVSKPPHPRLVASIWGQDKTGKTSFALSFPPPIAFINFDFGLDELIYSRPELIGNLYTSSLKITETMIARDLEPVLEEFQEKWESAINFAAQHAGTVVIDTTTQLWQIVQDVKLTQVRDDRLAKAEARTYANAGKREEAIDRASKPLQLDYGQANMFMAALLRRVFHHERLNACFVNRAKPVFSEQGRQIEGAWEYQGFGEMSGIAQVHLQLLKKQEGGTPTHFARITRCRFDTSLEGLDIKNPTYETVRGMLMPPAED